MPEASRPEGVFQGHSTRFLVDLIPHRREHSALEFTRLGAGEIKRGPEVETLLVARDNGNEAVKEILDWLTERIDSGPRSLPLNTTLYSQID